MNVLIPVRYPLTDPNKRAIQRGMELVDGIENSELLIFYLNEVQKKQRLSRQSLREAVEAEFGGIEANYLVQDCPVSSI